MAKKTIFNWMLPSIRFKQFQQSLDWAHLSSLSLQDWFYMYQQQLLGHRTKEIENNSPGRNLRWTPAPCFIQVLGYFFKMVSSIQTKINKHSRHTRWLCHRNWCHQHQLYSELFPFESIFFVGVPSSCNQIDAIAPENGSRSDETC